MTNFIFMNVINNSARNNTKSFFLVFVFVALHKKLMVIFELVLYTLKNLFHNFIKMQVNLIWKY